MAKQSLVVEYAKLLQKHRDISAKEVREFVEKHKDAPLFVKRMKIVNKLWELKESNRIQT